MAPPKTESTSSQQKVTKKTAPPRNDDSDSDVSLGSDSESSESEFESKTDPTLDKIEQELMKQAPGIASKIKNLKSDRRPMAIVAEELIGTVLSSYPRQLITKVFFILDALLWEELDDWVDESDANARLMENLMSEASTCRAMMSRMSVSERLAMLYDDMERRYAILDQELEKKKSQKGKEKV